MQNESPNSKIGKCQSVDQCILNILSLRTWHSIALCRRKYCFQIRNYGPSMPELTVDSNF